MPAEKPTTLYLNDTELVTVQTTPVDLADFARGYLYSERIIQDLADIQRLVVDPDRALIWVDLQPGLAVPAPATLVAGSERGVAPPALDLTPPAPASPVAVADLAAWMREMTRHTPLYGRSGGTHAAMAVHRPDGVFLVREDIGRHNAVDKVLGAALALNWTGADMVVLTSGRITYEMCIKLARCGVGVAATRTAVTSMAVDLAEKLGIDLVGYLRAERDYALYTAGHRLAPE